MRRVIAIGLGLFAAAPVAAAQICLENRSDETLLLAVEAANGQRRVASRASGQRLCLAGAARGAPAVVSVFSDAGQIEGCSRLARMGETVAVLRYGAFDRCAWALSGPAE